MSLSAGTYYCWHCYSRNRSGIGACVVCSRPVESPPGTSYCEELLWALGHPLPGRQMIAAQILGERREPSAEQPLRRLVREGDPYLAAQALESLILIVGVDPLQGLLRELAQSGAPAVTRVAWAALDPSG